MPVRVQFIRQAFDDLVAYAATGNLALFLKKLLRLEEVGKDAGQPLGGSLVGWRKIVVGDRNWRIVFQIDHDETAATILVIGDREDAACYAEAQRRLEALGRTQPETISLAAAMFQISQGERAAKRARRRR
jgi:mRNA interferase RelE/StbE